MAWVQAQDDTIDEETLMRERIQEADEDSKPLHLG